MKSYKYYTPLDLAEYLISLMPERNFKTAIDICCGSWNLLNAATSRYPNIRGVGVDIDQSMEKIVPSNATFYCEDGRNFVKHSQKFFDLILSNPPFGKLEEDNKLFSSNDNENKDCFSALINNRYECEMIYANLLLAKSNSILLFILPSTFVEGQRFKKARQQIAMYFDIHLIAKLPDDTFGTDAISTYAIVLEKTKFFQTNTRIVDVIKNGTQWTITNEKQITRWQVIDGYWHVKRVTTTSTTNKQVVIFRGNISSQRLLKVESQNSLTVFHNSGECRTEIWHPSIRFFEKKDKKDIKIAKLNDILVCRVGKSAGYWCRNNYGDVAISDCVFVISYFEGIEQILERHSVNGRLNVPLRGVSTKYITAEDIKQIVL